MYVHLHFLSYSRLAHRTLKRDFQQSHHFIEAQWNSPSLALVSEVKAWLWSLIVIGHWQWCGLRPLVLGKDRSETKKVGLGLGLVSEMTYNVSSGTLKSTILLLYLDLVLQVSCCVVKHNLVTLVVIMILEDTAAFQVLFLVFSILCLEPHYCGDQQGRLLT